MPSYKYFPVLWLSYLPWFEVFYKLLNNLADYLKKGQVSLSKRTFSVLYRNGCNHGQNVHIFNRLMRWKHYWLPSTSNP